MCVILNVKRESRCATMAQYSPSLSTFPSSPRTFSSSCFSSSFSSIYLSYFSSFSSSFYSTSSPLASQSIPLPLLLPCIAILVVWWLASVSSLRGSLGRFQVRLLVTSGWGGRLRVEGGGGGWSEGREEGKQGKGREEGCEEGREGNRRMEEMKSCRREEQWERKMKM